MRLRYLDGLRAFAVITVVMAHHRIYYLAPASFGVTLFFVISGYVITRLLIREHAETAGFRVKAFFARRGLKILPPFLLAITLPTLLLWGKFHFDPVGVASQNFFFYNWFQINNPATLIPETAKHIILPGSEVVWSLAVEEQFYILIALAWFFISTRSNAIHKLRVVYTLAFLGSILMRWIIAVNNTEPLVAGRISRIVWGTDCRLSGIALGGLIAIAMSGEKPLLLSRNFVLEFVQKYARVFFFIGLFSIAIPHFTHKLGSPALDNVLDRSIEEVAGALLIVSGFVSHGWPKSVLRLMESRIVQMIGLASYSIYLTHDVFKSLVTESLLGLSSRDLGELGGHISLPFGFTIYFGLFIAAAVSVVAGLLVHQIADAPMERFRKKWRMQGQNEQTGSALPS